MRGRLPQKLPFSYVATRELLRRDAGIATSRRRKKGIEKGKEGKGAGDWGTGKGTGDSIAWNWSPEGTSGEREGGVKIQKKEKVKRSKGQKSHLTKVKK